MGVDLHIGKPHASWPVPVPPQEWLNGNLVLIFSPVRVSAKKDFKLKDKQMVPRCISTAWELTKITQMPLSAGRVDPSVQQPVV